MRYRIAAVCAVVATVASSVLAGPDTLPSFPVPILPILPVFRSLFGM
jgi:hypothetical protein